MTLAGGGELQIEKIYPLDASFDVPEDVPVEVADDKRYKKLTSYTIQEVAEELKQDMGKGSLDILVHSLANGPEVQTPLVDTSRRGYLAAVGSSAYSLVSMVQRFGPYMGDEAAVVSLSYLAAEKVIPGYGGGMSSAKAALESDTRTLAYEAGRRWGLRINTISAGPLSSRAARAIGSIEKIVDYYPFIEGTSLFRNLKENQMVVFGKASALFRPGSLYLSVFKVPGCILPASFSASYFEGQLVNKVLA